MIIADKNNPVIKSGIGTESHFNIKDENVAHIFSILRNQLYSDKIGAIIREYVTNAIDAHVESNVTRPISITVPSRFSNEFIVRDYGKGLSHDEIVEIFASYGASTKRQSNSFTGMLGIGSKSAFAYTQSFTIKSRYAGTETIYQAFIDESNIGTIAVIHSQPTTESGLSVHVSIQMSDITQFHTSLIDFFQYIDYRPEFLGLEINIPQGKITTQGKSWKMIHCSKHYWQRKTDVYFVMGNVTYPSSLEILSNQLQIDIKWLSNLNNIDLVLDIPIGKVKPSASRETLEFNTLTKEYLTNAFHDLRIEFIKSIRESFEQCKTRHERHCMAYELESKFHSLVPYDIKQWVFKLGKSDDILDIKEISRNFPYIIVNQNAYIASNTVYVVYDMTQKVTHIQPRVLEYFETLDSKYERVCILKFETPEKMNKLMNHSIFQGADIINAITLPFKLAIKTTLKSEQAQVYEFRRGQSLNIESWNPAKSDIPSDAVYIEISSFKPKHYQDNTTINDAISDLRGAFGIKIPTIYGVRTADLKKTVQPTWIELKDYINQEVQAWKLNNPDKVRDYEYFKDSNVFQKDLIGDFEPWSHLKPSLKNHYRNAALYFEAEVAIRKIGIEIFKYNPPKEFEELYSRYPFMRAFCSQMSHSDKIRLIGYLDMS